MGDEATQQMQQMLQAQQQQLQQMQQMQQQMRMSGGYPAVSGSYAAVSGAYPAVSGAYPAVSGAYAAVEQGDGDTLLDLKRMRDVIGFVLRSVRRHLLLVSAIVAGMAGMAALALAVLPKAYVVETRILAQRNVVLPMLGNPQRTLPAESDTPTRLAAEAVMKRANLEAIITKTKLLDRWQSSRAPLARFRDWARERVSGPLTTQERTDALVGTLERRMWVNVGEGTVTIGVKWPDAVQAYEIVQNAQQNFLQERHGSEISAITESVGILEGHAARVHDEIEVILGELGAVRQETLAELRPTMMATRRAAAAAPAAAAAARQAARPAANVDEVEAVQARLAAVQRTLVELEQTRQRRMTELQGVLSAQRTTYGPEHPEIQRTQASLRSVNADTAQMSNLRQEEGALRARLTRLGGDGGSAAVAPVAGERESAELLMLRAELSNLERQRVDSVLDERQTYARSRLRIAVSAYEGLLERLEAARIELETTRAAFKYRYAILKPAQVPQRVDSPKPALLLGGGLVLGVMLALFAALALDIVGGRVLEAWQIERLLGVRVLGEARIP